MRTGLKILAAVCFWVFCFGPVESGWAQEEEQQQQKTRRVEALSEKVHRRLSKAQEAIEAKEYTTAEALLTEIMELRGVTPYERATTYRVWAYIHIEQDNGPAAIDAFLRVIQEGTPDVIGEGLYYQTLKTLAQLYMREENYVEAVRYGRQWLDSLEEPQPKDYILLAFAYLQMEDWRQVQDYALQAIETARRTGVEIEENWWSILNYSHLELEEYPEALEISKILVTQWPKKNYWLQLGGLYSYVEDEPRQLAAYWSSYDQGLMTSSSELTTVATLLMMADFPYKAAVILQEGIDNGSIEGTADNFRRLAQAWQVSREAKRAVDPLRKAAENEEDPEDKAKLYLRLAENHNALSQYEECTAAVRDALRQRGLESTGRAYLLLGQCLFELEEYDQAADAFSDAADDPDVRRTATQWRNHVTVEVARLKDLEAKLARYAD